MDAQGANAGTPDRPGPRAPGVDPDDATALALDPEALGCCRPYALSFLLDALIERAELEEAESLVEAAEDLLECGRRLSPWRPRNPCSVPWRSDAAPAPAVLGERGEAARPASGKQRWSRAYTALWRKPDGHHRPGKACGSDDLGPRAPARQASAPLRLLRHSPRDLVILGTMSSKVSVVGAGHVGAAVANALVLLRVCDQVVLYDRDASSAEGEAWDIADAIPLLAEMQILPTADYADLRGSDVVVVAAGPTRVPGQSRLDLLGTNAGITVDVVRELDRVTPEATVILVSNPVDVLTRIALDTSARPAHRILGSGTVLDGARLRYHLGKLLDVEKEDVHAYVIGEHGDSSFPVWSSVTVGAMRLQSYGLPVGTSLPELQEQLAAATRRRGAAIHERKGYTSYGVAAAVARIARAIVRDEKRIFMTSVPAAAPYGVGDVVLSVPCVIGRAGVERQLLLALSQDEQQMLRRSAAVLDAAYQSLTSPAGPPPG